MRDLTLLLLTMLLLVSVVDAVGDRVRSRILAAPFLKSAKTLNLKDITT